MKARHEDFKWNGILIFGKRYGRFNIVIAYLVINGMVSLLITASLLLLTGSVAEYLRGILTCLFLGFTLFAFKAIGYTNVLLIASPKSGALCLNAMKSKLVLIESTNTCLKFKKATEEKGYVYVFDIQRNMIWLEKYYAGHFPEERKEKMKANRQDIKWDGILILGKRYGRYNLLVVYLVANKITFFLFFFIRRYMGGTLAQILRGISTGIFVGSTLTICNALDYTNVLLVAPPKICALYLNSMKSKLSLTESNNTYKKFRSTVNEQKDLFLFYDITKNMIWIK